LRPGILNREICSATTPELNSIRRHSGNIGTSNSERLSLAQVALLAQFIFRSQQPDYSNVKESLPFTYYRSGQPLRSAIFLGLHVWQADIICRSGNIFRQLPLVSVLPYLDLTFACRRRLSDWQPA
jgi:hypothetical protein